MRFTPTPTLEVVAAHRSTHRKLLGTVDPRGAAAAADVPALDAVVVTTCRDAAARRSGLTTAVDLARTFGCPVVVLAAGRALETGALDRLSTPDVEVVVVDVDRVDAMPVRFAVDEAMRPWLSQVRRPDDGLAPRRPIGETRNLGLMIARSVGWQRVLLLDDDVRPRVDPGTPDEPTLDPAGLRSALAAMTDGSEVRAVGWVLTSFPDNSVVCRARRSLCQQQGQFIGGGALLVRCDAQVPFFPTVYNEDWLFLLGALIGGRPADEALAEQGERWRPSGRVLIGGVVNQDPYPAYRPGRARWEEFGDVLAEGMFGLLHPDAVAYFRGEGFGDGHPFPLGSCHDLYWEAVVRSRRDMLLRLATAARRGHTVGSRAMAFSLDEARRTHDTLLWCPPGSGTDPEVVAQDVKRFFSHYTSLYRKDLDTWQAFLADDTCPRWVEAELDVKVTGRAVAVV